MKTNRLICWALLMFLALNSYAQHPDRNVPFDWKNANVYFLLTDRFYDGDPSNNNSYGRQMDGAPLRSFLGGDLKGITQRINENYFNDLGISAIWMTPPVQQIRGFVDEGTGKSYAFHGYWARDWSNIDENYGNMADLKEMVDAAHARGIRVVMDIVLNHVGPENALDQPNWPRDWVRTGPTCQFSTAQNTQECSLVDNLPDIFTESESAVNLPQWLLDKWNNEGRLQQELTELDAFFNRTGYPRAPKYYIIKWLTDYVRELGIDGFRVDTTKHIDAPDAWPQLKAEGVIALRDWKFNHPAEKLDDEEFWMTGEVFDYSIRQGRTFSGNGFQEDYYSNGFDNLINFDFISFARNAGLEQLFSDYSNRLQNQLNGVSVLNFSSNHDVTGGRLFDQDRIRPFEAGTKLLLAPGASQVYYGDESNRTLTAPASGDAVLRSFMNWNDLNPSNNNPNAVLSRAVLNHWQKLGRFRREHISVGAGIHSKLQDVPYTFKREYTDSNPVKNDQVIVVDGIPEDPQPNTVSVFGVFANGTELRDYFSGETAIVTNGNITFNTPFGLLLIGEPKTGDIVPAGCNFTSLNLRGTFNGFGVQAMTCDGNNIWSGQATFTNVPNNRFKFDKFGDWTDNFGDNQADGIAEAFGDDIFISESGTYDITFNDQTLAYTVTCIAGDCSGNNNNTCNFPSLNLRGTFNGFGSQPMTCTGNNTWTGQATFTTDPNNRFKFDLFGDWSDNYGDNQQDGIAEAFGNDILINQTGTYDITFNDQTLAYTFNCVANCGGSNSNGISYRFRKPSNWNDAYIYLFDADQNTTLTGFNDFPGQVMNPIGNDWFEFSANSNANIGIVFNENINGGNQSSDLFRTTSGWYANGQWTDNCPFSCPTNGRLDTSTATQEEEELNDRLSIFPNPVKDLLTITLPDQSLENITIRIVQMDGKTSVEMNYIKLDNNQLSINLQSLDQGLYLLNVLSNDQLISRSRVIKE